MIDQGQISCPSVIAHLMKSTIAFAFASSIFGLWINSLYTSRYEKLAMGYVSAPGALISETDSHDLSPAGRDFPTAATPAFVDSNVGFDEFTSLILQIGIWHLCSQGISHSTYPIVLAVPLIAFATPSLPGAPMPVGHWY